MGNEKPEAPKTSTKFEPLHDTGADHDGPVQTPLQKDAYAAPPAQEVAQVGGQNPPPAKDAPAADGAQKDAPAPAPAGKDAPAEKKVVTDKAEAAAGKSDEPIDPYEHIDNAQTLRVELDALVAQNRKPDEYIPVRINGELKEMKVADRVAQLKTDMAKEIEIANKGASTILMVGDGTRRGIDDIAKANTADRDKLAKELGLDPAKLNIDLLGREYTKAAGNKERQDKIAALGEVLVTRDSLTRLHFAPMAVKMLEAEFRGRGYLDPKMKAGEIISEDQLQKAADTFRSAPMPGSAADIAAFGDGKEIRDAKEVYATTARTLDILRLDQQQQLGKSVVAETELAKKPGEDPETHFKNAIKIADSLKVGYLAMAAHDPVNKEVAQEIVDTIRMGSDGRLKYAEFLVTKGRYSEAQGLMAQVKADSPELIYEMKGDQPAYRKYQIGDTDKYRSYEELDRAVALGVTVNPATFEQAHSILFDKLGKDKLGTEKDSAKFKERLDNKEFPKDSDKIKYLRSDDAKSTEALRLMIDCRDQAKADVAEANKALNKELEVQEAAKKKWDDKGKLSQDEEVEKARVERVIASLKVTKAEREQYINRIDALTDFTEGVVHLSLGGAQSAHTLFDQALKKDPSLDAEFAKMKEGNPDVKTLTELSQMTDDNLEAYWKRNNKKFAIAGAAIAGTLTGVGLIGACGYVGAGVTTTAVVATVGGGAAGGLTSWGIQRTVNDKAGWPEFRDGAKVGALSAALVASPWAAQVYRAKLGTDVAVNTSQIGNLASKIGVTRGTLLGSMAMSYTFAAGDVYFENKPIGKAAVDGTREGIYNSLLLGISQKWGMPTEGGSTAATAARMFNKTTFATGFGLAALPQAFAMAIDGKPLKEAVSETMRDGMQNTLMFGLMSKMKVTDPAKESTLLGRYGLNKWTGLGIAGVSGYTPVRNYFDGKQTFSEAAKDWLTNAAIDTAAVGMVKRYGLNDYGTGSRIAMPTFKDTASYAQRSFMMQESWNVAVAVGSKQFLHDIGGKPYYIKDQGGGFVAPLLADFFDRNFGKELDASHPGDRKIINQNLDGLNTPLTAGKFADKKNVDPLQKDPKQGLFFDYSKKPPKPPGK